MTARVTLPEVAAAAGVSLSSASRALNGTGASRELTARVRAAAETLGYQPDATGRSLRMRRTLQIAFAVADIGNPVYVEMMAAIQGAVADQGYRLVVANTGDTAASTAALVRGFASGLVDGLIVSPLRVDDDLVAALAQAAVPVVVIGRDGGSDALDVVTTDSAAGVALALEHVAGLGRSRIGFLNGPTDTTPGAARQRGVELAASSPSFGGQVVDQEVAVDFTVSAGLEAAGRLIARNLEQPLDAIVAANDLLAIGAIRAARHAGLAVPGDLAVTGMDDTELGKVYEPTLTSVSLGSAERGRAAAELMLSRLAGQDAAGRRVFVPPALRVRDSSGTGPA